MNWMILPLKRYAKFSGRSRRMEYWMFALLQVISYVLFAAVMVSLGVSAVGRGAAAGVAGMIASFGIIMVVFGLFWLVMLLPSIAVAVRRLHDTGRSGWWLMAYVGPYLLSLVLSVVAVGSASSTMSLLAGASSVVALIALFMLLVFMCLPGTSGSNAYGPDPISPDRTFAEVFR